MLKSDVTRRRAMW